MWLLTKIILKQLAYRNSIVFPYRLNADSIYKKTIHRASTIIVQYKGLTDKQTITAGLEVIKLFSYSTQLSTNFMCIV